jgi:hypothetical protein
MRATGSTVSFLIACCRYCRCVQKYAVHMHAMPEKRKRGKRAGADIDLTHHKSLVQLKLLCDLFCEIDALHFIPLHFTLLHLERAETTLILI